MGPCGFVLVCCQPCEGSCLPHHPVLREGGREIPRPLCYRRLCGHCTCQSLSEMGHELSVGTEQGIGP
jgi:hypothetical protein